MECDCMISIEILRKMVQNQFQIFRIRICKIHGVLCFPIAGPGPTGDGIVFGTSKGEVSTFFSTMWLSKTCFRDFKLTRKLTRFDSVFLISPCQPKNPSEGVKIIFGVEWVALMFIFMLAVSHASTIHEFSKMLFIHLNIVVNN